MKLSELKEIATETTLADLAGIHVLDWAAMHAEFPSEYSWGDPQPVIAWGMDGKTFIAVEDANDGYRSMLDTILVLDGKHDLLNGAAPIDDAVMVRHITKVSSMGETEQDMIEIFDYWTSHLWARIGTEHMDDYYPLCILDWRPRPE